MKTLNNHVILFDNECPMCHTYTKAFVKSGMLAQDGRQAYQEIPKSACPLVDWQRATDEIALVNTETGEVTYGIQSLFKIIAHAMPFFSPLLVFSPFAYLMQKIYAFISYNRRVIIPAAVKENTLQPTLNLCYRIAYLLLTWAITAYILTDYAHLLTDFVPLGSKYREYLICGGQLFFQGMIISFYRKEKLWDYLGNMMTISFAGSLLLLPVIILAGYFSFQPLFFLLYFLMVAGLMFLEHIRRSKLLKLGWLLSITWALYRLIVLGLILIL
ncbi:Protein of unknown function, DUF393 [Pedobacter terrae]|uniref:DUF393 domain-containing protein n=1 Tax=Pedobacter terrae TaxID=405671 RepID=A0A1G7RMG9_9SPHI|nr:DCC1-like thiol-disulfide oxidoreductase family protein [Pedobacter terrae]SDG11936.1 Protein of unknown function, DUF393 [Pedobacter terrae]